MDKKLLDILVCPVSGAALTLADADTLTRANNAIRSGDARHADGSPVYAPLEKALLTDDGATLYRVEDDIPLMLPDRGIEIRS